MCDENFMPDIMELENLHELSLRFLFFPSLPNYFLFVCPFPFYDTSFNRVQSGFSLEATEEEKKLLWSKKEFCARHFPQLLPLVVGCVDWVSPSSVQELYQVYLKNPFRLPFFILFFKTKKKVLDVWERLSVYDALYLLESQFADSR